MQKRILIIRQDRIGDAVLATAIPREIKKRWPDALVGVLVRSYTKPLFEHNPQVDVILTDDPDPDNRGAGFLPLVREVRRHRFTHALMLLPEARVNYLTFCAGIPFRVGHGLVLFHALTLVRPVMTRKFRKGRHEAQYSMDLARSIGVRTENVDPEIHLTDEERERSRQRAATWGRNGRRVIGLHTTSGRSAPNWEPEVWAELAAALIQDETLQVVITDNRVPPVLRDLPGVVYPNVGGSLREALVHFKALDLLVSASTGPMHLAAALGVKTLSLFCPLPACEPALWGPLGNVAEFVLPEAEYCRDRCPGDPHVCNLEGSHLASAGAVAGMVGHSLSS